MFNGLLTYCEAAIEVAQSQKHRQVTIEDMQVARRRFSENRLKDLADEYTENLPHIEYVLKSFYGLGNRFTLNGLASVIAALIADVEVQARCKWLFSYTAPGRLAELLYNIGFFGLAVDAATKYRSSGSTGSHAPSITSSTHLVVHPTYADALSLQNIVVDSLEEGWELQQHGVISEIPNAISQEEYYSKLLEMDERLKLMQCGRDDAAAYEDLVGDVIKYCFFQWLGNVQAQVRDVDGLQNRDWIAANIAHGGFWEAMRQRYSAMSVVWECKNKEELQSGDFHQASYYAASHSVVLVVYRGPREHKKHYYQHIKKIYHDHHKRAIVLLLTDQDLQTFIRQTLKGKTRDSHIREIYDTIERAIA